MNSPAIDRSAAHDPDIIDAARAAIAGFFAAINASDQNAVKTKWLHFPHFRLHSGKLTVMNTPDELASPVLSRSGKAAEWAKTVWDFADPIDSGPDKVHFRVQFTWHRADGSAIGTYRSLYIVTLKDGRWGIQGRSTWAE